MKIVKKIALYLFYVLVGLILAGILLPFVYKDKLMAVLKENINKNIAAEVDFSDADLSFIKSFPDIKISIDSLTITGIEQFDGITLYKADQTNLDVGLLSLLGDNPKPKINNISLIHPDINIIILDEKNANYLVSKDTTSSPSNFTLQLSKYSIENGKISYQDNTLQMFAVLDGVQHSGKGDFTQDIFDLTTSTQIEKLYVKYEGQEYLKNAKAKLDAKINMNFVESKYTLKDNILKLNELDVNGDGFVQMKDDDININIEFKSASEDFKSFLSIVPKAFTKDFDQIQTKGTASINGKIAGVYNSVKGQMPAFDVNIKINDGLFKYPSLPQTVKDIFANITIKATRSDYKDMSVNIPTFKMKIGEDPIEGRLVANNLTGDQSVDGMLKGNLNLKNIQQSFPLEGVESLTGDVFCDVIFGAKMSDVNTNNYEAMKFDGTAKANNIVYKMAGKPTINLANMVAKVNPKMISVEGSGIQLGKSQLQLKSSIENPLAYFSTEKDINITIQGQSDHLDLNEWMTTSATETTAPQEVAPVNIDENLINHTNLTLDLQSKKTLYSDYTIHNLNMKGGASANSIKIERLSGEIEGSDFSLDGHVMNAFDYLFKQGIIDGEVNFNSNVFDANKFMSTTTSSESAPMEVMAVPANVRMNVRTHIKDLTYTNLKLKDFKGDLQIQNQEIALRNMETNTLGGKINMEGLYNTTDLSKPDFSVKLDLSKIKFVEAISHIETFKKLAPIAAYIDGFFNTTLVMKGKLGDHMTPDLSTLDASGFLETVSGTLKGFKPVNEMAEKLGLTELKDVKLDNTKNWFEIVQGFVEMKDYNRNIKGIDVTVAGKHGFGKDMDYNFDLVIPRELLKNNKVTAVAENGLGLLEKEASKLGLNIDQGPNLYVNVKMTGSITKPVFKITPKTGKGGSVTDVAKNAMNDAIATAKDTINKELKKKEAEIRDTVTKIINKEAEKIKTQAETAIKKAADSIKTQVKDKVVTKLDSITKNVIPDTLKKQAKDVIDAATKGEAEKIKEKLDKYNPFKKKKN